MKATQRLRKALRDNQVVVVLLVLALTAVTVTYYLILRTRGLDASAVNNQILLFFLRNVNAVLITAVAFVLIRNLVKLWIERRRKRLGSKFRTKLVATYIGISLVPVLLLFVIANQLVQGSLDNLFSSEVEELLAPGYHVAQELTSTLEQNARDDVPLLLDAIRPLQLDDDESLPEIARRLQQLLEQQRFDLAYVFRDADFIQAVINPESGLAALPDLSRDFLLDSLRDGSGSRVLQLAGGELIVLAATAGEPDESARRPLVVVGNVLPAETARRSAALVEAYQQQRQIAVLETEIRAIYLLGFLTITLVLLLTVTWIGLYLARRVTGPIEDLAEATRRITGGDLDYRVADVADDELGVLVHSFNRMTGELQRNKTLLEHRNQELRLTNENLDAERNWTHTVLQSVSAGVLATDPEGVVLTCNHSAAQMLGTSTEGLVGSQLSDAEIPTALRDAIQQLLDSGHSASCQVRAVVRGAWRTYELSAAPLVLGETSTGGSVIVIEDLSELIQAQQLATWNEAARRIAHEIKNPLTPIRLSAERLLKKHNEGAPDFGETLGRSVDIIVREVGSMKSMVDEFARFARMPRPQAADLEILPFLGDLAALYRDIKEGVEVCIEVEPEEGFSACFDEEQVRGALANLIDNAIDATVAPGIVTVRAQRDREQLLLEVHDTGRGIEPEALDRLFLPYYSTKRRGSGLGLAIVHRIVDDHHGRIQVISEPGDTRFVVELPQP